MRLGLSFFPLTDGYKELSDDNQYINSLIKTAADDCLQLADNISFGFYITWITLPYKVKRCELGDEGQ